MGTRAGHPTGQPINQTIVEAPPKAQTQIKAFTAKVRMLYDIAYIINLDSATERLAKITKQFDEIGLPYQRFKAVDGYKVVLENLSTKHTFNGRDLKANPALLDIKAFYQVTCNPDEYLPTTFNLLPSISLTAGELGIWCSQRIIWQDIVNKKYQNAMIFEDDALIKVDDFPRKLNKFIVDLPASYDIAYPGVYQKKGYKIPLPDAKHVSKFSENSQWDCLWSVLISNKGAQALISDDLYFMAVDNYLQVIAQKLIKKPFTLEAYRSTKNLIWYDNNSDSAIQSMGRITNPNYKIVEEEEDSPLHGYDMLYVINLKPSEVRWDKVSTHLNNIGITYTRFNATDGYEAQIKDMQNNQIYTGFDIKNKNFSMEHLKNYQIICNPLSEEPSSFNFLAKLPLRMAGEIGAFCSHRLVWENIIRNNYKNTVVLEDDFVSKTDDFAYKLNRFVSDLPSTYDIAFIDLRHKNGTKTALPKKEHISKFESNAFWNGMWASVVSQKGAQKLYNFSPYFAPVDINILFLSQLNSTEESTVEVYVSSLKLAGHEGPSDICAMGIPNGTICLDN